MVLVVRNVKILLQFIIKCSLYDLEHNCTNDGVQIIPASVLQSLLSRFCATLPLYKNSHFYKYAYILLKSKQITKYIRTTIWYWWNMRKFLPEKPFPVGSRWGRIMMILVGPHFPPLNWPLSQRSYHKNRKYQ